MKAIGLSHIDELKSTGRQPSNLMPFVGNPREAMPHGLPFHLKDYIELVEWSGRIIKESKLGSITKNKPPMLDRIAVDVKNWNVLTSKFESLFKSLVGEPENLRRTAEALGYIRTPGARASQTYLQ